MTKTKKYFLFFLLGWTLILTTCFIWYIHDDRRETKKSALFQARSSFAKDVLYRRWNAKQGGVYVLKSKDVPPNPYLKNLPERDIVSTTGRELTLVNPAYMTRMVYDMARESGHYYSHITSLKPLRPENRADAWEKRALRSFEGGVPEVYSEEIISGKEILRFMKPLFVEEVCLKCHAAQGYVVGDVRGGISVSVPMAPYYGSMRYHLRVVGYGVFLIWLIGVAGIVISFRNIASRERSLVNAATVWSNTFDAINDFVSVHDDQFCFVKVNKALADFLGKQPSELIGQQCYDELHYTDGPHEKCPMVESMQTGNSVTREIDDERIGIPLLISVSPIYDPEGMISGYVHIAKDMTEMKKAQDALQKSEMLYKDLFNQAPLAYQSLDSSGHVIQVNKAWEDLLGYGQKEAVGLYFGEFVTPEMQDVFSERFKLFKEAGEIENLDFELVRKDGSSILVSANGKIGRDMQGDFKQTHCILHNVTADRQREKELHRYQEELEELVADRTKELEKAHKKLLQKEKLAAIGKLSGSVAHDIRNPLGAISNSIYYINMISSDATDANIRKHIAIMESEVKRASEIINDLMDFSRQNAPNFSMSSINALIQSYSTECVRPEGISVEMELDPELPVFFFDASQVRRVVANLFANAIQSMAKGGQVRIATKALDGSCQIIVTDTGCGVADADIHKIFEPLFTTKAKGVGLGLSIVKTFVERHGGTVEVASTLGEGSRFTVILPLKVSELT